MQSETTMLKKNNSAKEHDATHDLFDTLEPRKPERRVGLPSPHRTLYHAAGYPHSALLPARTKAATSQN